MTLFKKPTLCMALVSAISLAACAHTSTPSSKSAAKTEMAKGDFNVKTVSCWDVLTVAEEDLNMAMMLIYGYNQGQSGMAEQTSSEIEASFTKAFAYCEANPDAPAITGFQ